ncbi:MAG: AMP-binding protein [Bacilli bacterium]|nr:AMP-binding protein [Bacilli bacterium]
MNIIKEFIYGFRSIFKTKFDNKPWIEYYSRKERKIKFTKKTIYDFLDSSISSKDYGYVALNYFDNKINYREFFYHINVVAKSLKYLGVREKDIVSICMPNTPEAIYLFYACNKIGAISDMIHPLSSPLQLKTYLKENNSKLLFMVDFDYERFDSVIKESNLDKVILISPKDSMPEVMKLGYMLTRDIKLKRPNSTDKMYLTWSKFIRFNGLYENKIISHMKYRDVALILHSGGTTGTPKGIMLSNYNFNAEAQQDAVNVYDVRPGNKILTILPIFHGFGLCVCVHCPLTLRVETILMPEFNDKQFYKIMKYDRPHVILGVPTLWEAMMNNPKFDKVNMSQMKYIISGGDHLPVTTEAKINDFLHRHGAHIEIFKGYGMTESVAASCYTFPGTNEPGSIGIPMVGNTYKIVNIKTKREVPLGEEGEILVNGPTVMVGYLNNQKETNEVLKKDKDGKVWLHTGDIGYISPNGIVYYTGRLKRMIVVSGFNVYPGEIEEVISSHPDVAKCSVIGIPHRYKITVPKAFIVLNKDCTKSEIRVKYELKSLCKEKLSVYSQPKDFEFRDELPKTLMGKVDYKELEKEK